MLVSVYECVDDDYDPIDQEMLIKCPKCGSYSLITGNGYPLWDGTVICEACMASYKLELRELDE